MVSRASHCHHTPQAFLAQSEPLTMPKSAKMTTSSAEAAPMRSALALPLKR